MNFSTGSNNPRNHFLRAGLQGPTKLSPQLMARSEFLTLAVGNNNNNNNINNNTNNNSNNIAMNNPSDGHKSSYGGPTFLAISKSRVPDIQMINKYYGLVPKKFVITARSDFSSSKPKSGKLRTRAAQSLDDETTDGSVDFVSNSRIKSSCYSENPGGGGHKSGGERRSSTRRGSSGDHNKGFDDSADVDELVARKMPVEKYKKMRRLKNCGRSLSMFDNCERMGAIGGAQPCPHRDGNGAGADRLDIQRVIKIDLNHMRWEETYQEKCKADTADGDEDANELDSELTAEPVTVPVPTKRGPLRKAASVDDQIMRNSVQEASERKSGLPSILPETKPDPERSSRRPATASPAASTIPNPPSLILPAPSSGPKVTPWTTRVGQSLADRRAKFQKSFSIYSDSVNNGGESDNEAEPAEGSGNNNSNSMANPKQRESKKSLHVQAPPEISTMISLISPTPPPDDDLQVEIETVDTIISECNLRIAEVEEKLVLEEKLNILEESESPTAPVAVSATTKDENGCKNVDENLITCPTPALPSPKGRRILKKAASISCEADVEPKKAAPAAKSRPQTSRPKNSVSFSNSNMTRYIPSRRETFIRSATISTPPKDNAAGSAFRIVSPDSGGGQNAGSKNRKILIKKALIEINNSSFNLGKKMSHVRPKTAPTADKKIPTAAVQMQKRQPLKASPPVKTLGMARKTSVVIAKVESKTTGKDVSPEPEPEPSPAKVRVLPRQSLSLSDEFLHEFGPDSQDGMDGSDIAALFINSKKREECLQVYEKMMKKGCNVKLETIFRGLMTPSEYRMFVHAKEQAEKKALEDAEEENVNPAGDAGISTILPSESKVLTE